MKKRYLFILTLLLIAASFLLLDHGIASAVLAPSQIDFPNSGLLVSADSVQSSIGEPNLVIIDARSADAYAAAHIPGAINIIHGNYWNFGRGLLPTAKLNKRLGAAGLTRNMTFVIYDNTTAAWGAAGRLFWMLEYLGCKNVHILDGGWDKWVVDAKPTEITANTLPPKKFKGVVKPSKIATPTDIQQKLKDKDFVLVDTRTDEEYIGWQLYGEARGGHIPNAKQIPYEWYFQADKTVLSYTNLKTLFESRGVTQDKEVVTYCTAGIRSGFAYFLLRLMDYPAASNYDGSMAQWSATASLPMEKMKRFPIIVHPSWVKALIDYHAAGSTTVAPPEYSYDRNHKFLIIEAPSRTEYETATAYKTGHIPGAIHWNGYLMDGIFPMYFMVPDADLKVAVGNLGVTADTTVVVYSSAGSGSPARLWYDLKYAGVKDVRFLNGGYEAYANAGYDTETADNAPVPVTYDGSIDTTFRVYTSTIYTRLMKGKPMYIGDMRRWEEHVGAVSGYDRIQYGGRIPTSIWLETGSPTKNLSNHYGDADNTIPNYTEVLKYWTSKGIKSKVKYKAFDKPVYFHCGNGHRSSWSLLLAYMMGYDNARNYADGWYDWSTIFTVNAACADSIYSPGICQERSGRPVDIGEYWPW